MTVAHILVGGFLALLLVFQQDMPTQALSLKMQPLIYKDTLKKGEKKKGFVDISNPTSSKLQLKTSVQAFRQIDDGGRLQFYDDPQVGAGIKADLDEFELGPREAIRMYFLIDGTKLPTGDVFGALFVSTMNEKQQGVSGSVRLGTLFTLINGTPGSREAQVTHLNVPFWQFGDGVRGGFTVKNTAKEGSATGFFPSVTVAIDPLHTQKQVESPLVFAGRARQSSFDINSSRLGFYKVSAAYGESKREKWVFMATGYWRIVGIGLILLLVAAVVVWSRFKSRKSLRF